MVGVEYFPMQDWQGMSFTHIRGRWSWRDQSGHMVEGQITLVIVLIVIAIALPYAVKGKIRIRAANCAKNMFGLGAGLLDEGTYCPLSKKPYHKEIRDGTVVVSCPNPEKHFPKKRFEGFPAFHWNVASKTGEFRAAADNPSRRFIVKDFRPAL